MAKSTKGVADRLRQLYRLQFVDSQIDKIQVLKGELPIEVSDLEDEIGGLETRVLKLSEKVAEVDKEISNHNANIKESKLLIERYEKQLEEVKNNREFEALSKEIELQKLEILLSEKKIGETSKVRELKVITLDEAKTKQAAKKENLNVKKVELEQIISKTEKEEKSLSKESKTAREEIDERLIRSYDRIRDRYRNGLAVVTVERDACGGCFNRIPPQMQIEIGLYKNIVACGNCGRVLVDEAIAEEHQEKVKV